MFCFYLTIIRSVNSCGFCSDSSYASAFLLRLHERKVREEKKGGQGGGSYEKSVLVLELLVLVIKVDPFTYVCSFQNY